MMSPPRQRLFVTGTDTGVGKTVVTSTLVRHWRSAGHHIGAYKPVASGCEIGPEGRKHWGDIEAYFGALEGQFPRERICPQSFPAPLAPPVAARQAGRVVDSQLLLGGARWWESQVDSLLVEGAGGLLSPLSDTESNADLAVALGYPVLVIARSGLGTINHTLLTVEAAQRRGLTVAGVVLNTAQPSGADESVNSNPDELARRCPAPFLGVLPYSENSDLLHHPAVLRLISLLEEC